ncbi:MAG: LamG-like jellyroll fold domain-containing protein [Opitutaceae bacterium]|nr:LamG-like jellyroll fold domain-containing protein [Opitutaceae bacterium]
MNKSLLLLFSAVACPLLPAAQPRAPEPVRAALGQALTFHASFDHGLNADFARGDRVLYSYSNSKERAQGGITGLPDDTIKIAPGAGRFGDALHFTKKNNVRPFFKDGGNIGYRTSDWSYTVSVWLRITPDTDLEPGYCDPVQFVGNDTNKGFIFLEWDKDSNPRYFRYAIRPLLEIWDPGKVGWAKLPFDRRPMVQVERAPFSNTRWTHVVFTAEHINSKSPKPVGRLYLDGRRQGAIENWDLTLGWTPESALLVLGAAYVGHMDELAIFNRGLGDDEVKVLFNLPNGVRELHAGAGSARSRK